jgi:hypothetical protein
MGLSTLSLTKFFARLVRILDRYQEQLRTIWHAIGSWILTMFIFFLAHGVVATAPSPVYGHAGFRGAST